jgi:phage terminase large subunit GpA-like protein
LLPFWVSWRSIVEEFIAARAAIRNGNKEPMQTFVTETLGEPWKDELGEIDDFDFLRDRCGTWKIGDPWPDELTRFMSADRQEAGGEHYWYVIRAVGPTGKTRLISYGRAETKWELEELRKSHSVPIENSIIDSGNGQSTAEVYRWCRATGWKAAKGDSSEGYIHRDPVSGRSFRRLWQISRVEPAIGKIGARQVTIRLYRWSNPGIKDLLFDSMTGTIPGWELPKDIGDDYLSQISAEHRVEVVDHLGHSKFVWKQTRRDNHLLDCELMICVALVASRLTPSAPTKANPPS